MADSQQLSDLPADILSIIARINSSDIHRLRFVCTSWRNSLPPRKPFSFPLEVPPLFTPSELASFESVIDESPFYRLSPLSHAGDPSKGWLFRATVLNPNTFCLLRAFVQLNYSPGTLPNRLNLLDYQISEVCKSYTLIVVAPSLKSNGKVLALWNYMADCEFAALALQCDGRISNWKFGDNKWSPVDTKGYHFRDLILYDGKCYAVDFAGVLGCFDSKFNLQVVCSHPMGYDGVYKSYLLECESDLYMVAKSRCSEPWSHHPMIDFELKLNRFNKCNRKWESIASLGSDTVFFLSDEASFSVSVKDFKGCKGNKVYVHDLCFCDKDGNICGVFHLDGRRPLRANHTQDFMRMFWPSSWLHA